jgi:hypothetical protein
VIIVTPLQPLMRTPSRMALQRTNSSPGTRKIGVWAGAIFTPGPRDVGGWWPLCQWQVEAGSISSPGLVSSLVGTVC